MSISKLLLSLLGVLFVAACQTAPQIRVDEEKTLKVLSWNVNFGIEGDRSLARALLKENPDVLFLQETNRNWERWAKRHLKRRYPFQKFRHHQAAGGLAVLSKTPFDDVTYVKSPVGWFPGWAVLVHTKMGMVQVLNVHLHPPVSESGNFVTGYFFTGNKRKRELRIFLDTLDSKWPTLVVGDFNEAGGAALKHAEERGLTCALHEVSPGENTWFWPVGPVTLRGALDHVLHDDTLVVVDAWTLDLGKSDHIPIVSVFARSPK